MPEQSAEQVLDMANAVRLVNEHHTRVGALVFAQAQVNESRGDLAELFTALEGHEVCMGGIATRRRMRGVSVAIADGGTQLRPNRFVVVRGVSLSTPGSVDIALTSTVSEDRSHNHFQVPYSQVTLFETEEAMLEAQTRYDQANQPLFDN